MTLINIRQLFSCFEKLNTTDALWHWSMFDTYTMRDLHTNLMYVYKIQHKHYSLCSERYSKYHQNIQDNRRRLLHTWVESEIFPITCFLLIKYRIITSLCLERNKKDVKPWWSRNIYKKILTLSPNAKFIFTSISRRKKNDPLMSFSVLFQRGYKLHFIFADNVSVFQISYKS
jgi:hypothetical protein